MSEYPKWKHHASLKPILIQNAEQEAKLSDAWQDTPAAFGVITAPSAHQTQVQELGFDPLAEDKVEESQAGEAEINVGPRRRK